MSLISGSTTREAAVTSYMPNSIGIGNGRYGLPPMVGGCIPPVSYRPPQAGQRSMDNICKAGETPEQFPSAMLQTHTWQEHTPNKDVLERADIPSMFALLSQRRLHWLGHVWCIEDGRIPKNVLYGELASGASRVGCPALRCRDACKQNQH